MVRSYILTPNDQEIIKRYLGEGIRLEGYSVLIARAKKSLPRLQEDLCLINMILLESEPRKSKIYHRT